MDSRYLYSPEFKDLVNRVWEYVDGHGVEQKINQDNSVLYYFTAEFESGYKGIIAIRISLSSAIPNILEGTVRTTYTIKSYAPLKSDKNVIVYVENGIDDTMKRIRRIFDLLLINCRCPVDMAYEYLGTEAAIEAL